MKTKLKKLFSPTALAVIAAGGLMAHSIGLAVAGNCRTVSAAEYVGCYPHGQPAGEICAQHWCFDASGCFYWCCLTQEMCGSFDINTMTGQCCPSP